MSRWNQFSCDPQLYFLFIFIFNDNLSQPFCSDNVSFSTFFSGNLNSLLIFWCKQLFLKYLTRRFFSRKKCIVTIHGKEARSFRVTISNFTKDKSNVALSHGELSWGPSIKDVCNLILIGMRGDTFTSLSFLDQILSAEFLSKLSKLFWRWKLTSI